MPHYAATALGNWWILMQVSKLLPEILKKSIKNWQSPLSYLIQWEINWKNLHYA